MKLSTLALISLAGAAAGLAACGSSNATDPGPASPEFVNAAPTYDGQSLQMSDSDATPPLLPQGDPQALTAASPDCHPHLFQRTHEVVSRLNRHFNKLLAHINDVIADHPKAKSGVMHDWEKIAGGVDRKFTITRTANADGSVTFAFELDAGLVPSTGTATLLPIFSGTTTLTPASATVLAEEKGSVSYNFDNLHAVYPNEKAQGQITDAFDRLRDPSKAAAHVKRTSTLTFTNFLPEEGDVHGPRNGAYTWTSEPGVGGSFSFADSLILLCPANPTSAVAEVTAVSRWYHPAAGAGIHGRTDAKATGGQIATGDTFEGVTCSQSVTSTTPAEGYWMMKLEDATGATVVSHADQTGAAPCDSVFGSVPATTDNATDYDFSAAVTFPNEW